MNHNQSESKSQKPTFLPPPPPPPISSLNLAPPTISQHSYILHNQKKHQRMINGEEEFNTPKEQVEAKCKNQFKKAQNNSIQAESTGEKITANMDQCQKCSKCGHWIQTKQMKLHLSFHVAPVFDNLLLGDKHSSESHKQLFVRNKVTHILNSADELKNHFQDQGIKYCNLKLRDQIGQYVIDQAIKGAQFIDKAIKEQGVVFVHCALGQSRSVSCIIMYLMLYKKMSYQDSLSLIKVTRPIARPNISYKEQLIDYQKKTIKS